MARRDFKVTALILVTESCDVAALSIDRAKILDGQYCSIFRNQVKMSRITYADIKNNEEIKTYIEMGNEYLGVLGYTEHYEAHSVKVAETAADILNSLGYSEREVELARIAGYMHDIGNAINRYHHALNGANMAFEILRSLGMDYKEVATVVSAVGNHDEDAGMPVSIVSAAVIIADKTDIRRSRVRNNDMTKFDIHDRVNFAVEKSIMSIDAVKRYILLDITTDSSISSVLDYFEIFLSRMLMCKRAAKFLSAEFGFVANGAKLI